MSLHGFNPLNKYRASVAPTFSDDLSMGYEAGSQWIYGQNIYEAVSTPRGAADWKLIYPQSESSLPVAGCVWPILTADTSMTPIWGQLTFDSSGNIVIDSAGYPVLGPC